MDEATLDAIAQLAPRIKECQEKLNGYTKTRNQYADLVSDTKAELDNLYAQMRALVSGS